MDKFELLRLFKKVDDIHRTLQGHIVAEIDWQQLADAGFRVQAMLSYRKSMNSTLIEANSAVRDYLNR